MDTQSTQKFSPLPMITLIQEFSCCGKECFHCPYIGPNGERHARGSIRIHKKIVLSHIKYLVETDQVDEAYELKSALKERLAKYISYK